MEIEEIVDDKELMEVARFAIEQELVEWRDERMSVPMRGNGFCIKEKDGTPSSIIRFGPETGMRIGLLAIAKVLKQRGT